MLHLSYGVPCPLKLGFFTRISEKVPFTTFKLQHLHSDGNSDEKMIRIHTLWVPKLGMHSQTSSRCHSHQNLLLLMAQEGTNRTRQLKQSSIVNYTQSALSSNGMRNRENGEMP